jgi:hypothetical protein
MTAVDGRSVMVTGAAGSLVDHIAGAGWCERILAVDLSRSVERSPRRPFEGRARRNGFEASQRRIVRRHCAFRGLNPLPASGVLSSPRPSHAFGRYKESPLVGPFDPVRAFRRRMARSSANAGMGREMASARETIGYVSEDNV